MLTTGFEVSSSKQFGSYAGPTVGFEGGRMWQEGRFVDTLLMGMLREELDVAAGPELHHLALRVADCARAAAFYSGVLGLREGTAWAVRRPPLLTRGADREDSPRAVAARGPLRSTRAAESHDARLR